MLESVRVLLLGAEPSEADHLAVWLSSERAFVKRSSWSEALTDLQQLSLNAVVLDTRGDLPQARSALDALRRSEPGQRVPVIALVSREQADRGAFDARVTRELVAPLHPSALAQALLELKAMPADAASPSPDDALASLLEARARTSDIRSVVTLLNSTAPFRFTSVLRFEPSGELRSIWTYDRANPELNSFPEDATQSSSYCARVRDSGEPFQMPDAALEPSVASHPARHSVLSYCGVPLYRADGTFYGTLCSYDVVPRFFQERSVKRLIDASGLLQKHWPELATLDSRP
jgi:hypothetical protein